jgi:hypothetical protein
MPHQPFQLSSDHGPRTGPTGIDMRALGYECARHVVGERATHVVLRKSR